jgi:hypothetical protein
MSQNSRAVLSTKTNSRKVRGANETYGSSETASGEISKCRKAATKLNETLAVLNAIDERKHL